MSHLIARGEERGSRTVHGDGQALAQDKAISALEGGDLAELVELQVLGGDAVGGDRLDELEVKVVLLGHDAQAGGARVALRTLLAHFVARRGSSVRAHSPCSCTACRKT